MATRPKDIGTRAETAVVRWARDHGFPGADRQPLRGNRDAGDIALAPGAIAEVKSVKTASTGQPGAKLLEEWLRQTDTERTNAGAAVGILIVKRSGTADVARWWAYMRLDAWLTLLGAPITVPNSDAPICTSVASLTATLRAVGYGTTHHEGDQP